MESSTTEKLVMSVAEAAESLQISKCTVYSLVHEGKLPAVRISDRRIVIPRAALNKMLEVSVQPT